MFHQASLLRFSSPLPIRKGSTIHFLDSMAACGHEEYFIESPPSLEFMAENPPLIVPNDEIDRSTPRCRLCDLTAASAREAAAVYPHPTFSSSVEALQRHIASAEQLIAEGIRKEELEAILPRSRRC
jgi:hypothetical protein